MGPFVSGRKGERYILSVIDCFSQYLILILIKDHNATTVSQALFERVIKYFGCPKKILSDRGTEFTGRVWAEMIELMGIKQLLTSPYYPQGNGIVERSHRTIGNMIRAQLANRDDRDWVDVLPGIMLFFNEMEQGNHGCSASQIMWGQGMNLPTDLIYTPREFGEGRSKYVKDLGEELREVRKRVAPFNPQMLDGVYKRPLVYCQMGFINASPFPALHLSRNAAKMSESLKISGQRMAKLY